VEDVVQNGCCLFARFRVIEAAIDKRAGQVLAGGWYVVYLER
jgi:hypothetical protein